MTITSATSQPSSACGPPIADMSRGIVMNGPAPSMLVMLSAVAGSRLKRRTSWGCSGGVVPPGRVLGELTYGIVELLTNASRFPSGDHDGTLIVPWPPYTYAMTRAGPPLDGHQSKQYVLVERMIVLVARPAETRCTRSICRPARCAGTSC